MEIIRFDNWSEAFSLCRDRDQPLNVEVNGECAKIFPSGSYRELTPNRSFGSVKWTDYRASAATGAKE